MSLLDIVDLANMFLCLLLIASLQLESEGIGSFSSLSYDIIGKNACLLYCQELKERIDTTFNVFTVKMRLEPTTT